MMAFGIFLHPKAYSFLKKVDLKTKNEIKSKLFGLEKNPKLGKPLKHSLFWSLKIKDYRAIYEFDKEKIVVLFIGHRKNVYDDFSKLF